MSSQPAPASSAGNLTTTHQRWGTIPDGSSVELYTLSNGEIELQLATYGARVVSLKSKDRDGKLGDVILGYDDLEGYLGDLTYQGAIVGRYANRIAGGIFTLGGKTYTLPQNNGPNALHGAGVFNTANWSHREIPGGVEFGLTSPDGDKGFPGTMAVTVRYTLEGNTVRIRFHATTDKLTVVNLTSHAYFNLSGHGTGTILDEIVQINADAFTPTNATSIPTGEIVPVASTPFDFRNPQAIGERIDEPHVQLVQAKGYDHNFVLRGEPGTLRLIATAHSPRSGRTLQVQTTEPGVQFYSGNYLRGQIGRNGVAIDPRTGFCLETQHFPDSPNKPQFPSTELKPGEQFDSITMWTFTAE